MFRERRDTRERRKRRKVPPIGGQRQVLRVPRQDRRIQQRITEIAEQVGGEDREQIVKEHRGDEEIANRREEHR
jgi:hypothetical protein